MHVRRRLAIVSLSLLCLPILPARAQDAGKLANPAIDMEGYLRIAGEAARHRQTRRVSEEEFLRMSRQPGSVVLDARSKARYEQLHIKGAVHLSFPDITIASLEQTLPDKDATILIYCNNNFRNAEGPFPAKIATASLNLSTYIALYNYGYRNVYELAPLIDIRSSKLPFESAAADAAAARPEPSS